MYFPFYNFQELVLMLPFSVGSTQCKAALLYRGRRQEGGASILPSEEGFPGAAKLEMASGNAGGMHSETDCITHALEHTENQYFALF